MSDLNSYLAELGDTAYQVFATLRTLDIHGAPKSPTACPVAIYLARRTEREVLVGNFTAATSDMSDFAFIPHPVKTFILGFDEYGRFQELRSE